MVMDPSSKGVAGQLVTWGTILMVAFALIAGIWNTAREVNQLQESLDRNCRILVLLDQDLRLHILSTRAILPKKKQPFDPLAPFPKVTC